MGDVAPMLNVLALPFLFRSIDHLHKVIDGPIGEEILGSLEPYGFIGLAFYDSGARSIYTVRQPVRALADLQRHAHPRAAIRSDGKDDQGARRRRRWQLPYGQVLTALSTNLVDGAENNWPSFVSTGHYKIAPLLHGHRAHDGSGNAGHVAARLAGAVARGSHDLPRGRARFEQIHARAMAELGRATRASRREEAGVTIIEHIDRKPFEDATKPLRDELRADPKLRSADRADRSDTMSDRGLICSDSAS